MAKVLIRGRKKGLSQREIWLYKELSMHRAVRQEMQAASRSWRVMEVVLLQSL